MCVRYYIDPEDRSLASIIEEAKRSRLSEKFSESGNALVTRGEVRPTNVTAVAAPGKNGERAVFPMRWGFRTPHGSLIINARTESAGEKPTFKDAFARHRCVVPASWYFEWEHTPDGKVGDRYAIRPTDGALTWLAGIYRIEDGLPVFTVLTREPTGELAKLHDRMPLILPEDVTEEWINPLSDPKELIKYAVTAMTAVKAQ